VPSSHATADDLIPVCSWPDRHVSAVSGYLAVHSYPTVTRIPGACCAASTLLAGLRPNISTAQVGQLRELHEGGRGDGRATAQAPWSTTRARAAGPMAGAGETSGCSASSVVGGRSSSCQSVWSWARGRRRRNMAVARERERKQPGLLARACGRRAAHAPRWALRAPWPVGLGG
jgi:hypothetical protein